MNMLDNFQKMFLKEKGKLPILMEVLMKAHLFRD